MKLRDLRAFGTPNDAVDAKKDEIEELLNDIKMKVTNFYYATEHGQGVQWAHAGTMHHIAVQLQEISNSLGVEGDDHIHRG